LSTFAQETLDPALPQRYSDLPLMSSAVGHQGVHHL